MPANFVLDIYMSILIPLVPAALIVILRVYARRIKNLTLWWDDWLAFLSLIGCIIYDVYTLLALRYGLGRRLVDIPYTAEQALYHMFLTQAVQEHTYTVAIGAAQLSLLALYWRLFKDITCVRRGVLALMGCVGIWIIVRLFITIFQCFPPAYLWDKTIEGGVCTIEPGKFFLGTVSTHLIIDLALIALPSFQISRLSLPLAQKAAIGIMFAFGFVICVASIMMIITSTTYDAKSPEIMYNTSLPAAWSAAEIHLSVISCCLPLMRPVVRVFGGWYSQNFASRKSTNDSAGTIKLASVRRSLHHMHRIKGESTLILNDTYIETTRIYGQGEGTDVVITGKRASGDSGGGDEGGGGYGASESSGGVGKEGAITVRYEVKMSFADSEQKVHGLEQV